MLTQRKDVPYQLDLYHQLTQQPLKHVVEEVDVRYQAYLTNLHFRNLQKSILERHNKERKRKEKLEKGFTLFFNLPPTEKAKNGMKHTAFLPDNSSPVDSVKERKRWKGARHSAVVQLRAKSAPSLKKLNKPSKWGDVVEPTFPITDSVQHECLPSEIQEAGENIENLKKNLESPGQIFSFTQPPTLQHEKPSLDLTVHIDLLTSWGNNQTIGLSGVQLFVVSPVSEELLPVLQKAPEELGGCSYLSRNNLISHPFDTTIPAFMWSTKNDNLPCSLRFSFTVPSHAFKFNLKETEFILCLWNYNDPEKLDCGARDFIVNVFHQNKPIMIYKGICNRGDGKHPSESTMKVRFTVVDEVESLKSCNIENFQLQLTPDTPVIRTDIESDERNNNELEHSVNLSTFTVHTKNNHCRQGFLSNVSNQLLMYNLENEDENNDLEASWTSLEFFNHFHAGRLNSWYPYPCVDPVKRYSTSTSPYSSRSSELFTANDKKEAIGSLPDVRIFDTREYSPSEHPVRRSDFELPRSKLGFIDIPPLPRGTQLVIDIVSTWGDPYYVGLSGLEIFTQDGTEISRHCRISADPSNINILPSYTNDPRVVENLIDGVNWTRDDVHMWLTPFSTGAHHLIQLTLPDWAKPLALVRVWNYNKSRVHTSRGARELIMYLDSQVIFHGEIKQAAGGLGSNNPNDFCEAILFTTEDDILEVVGQNDFLFEMHALHNFPTQKSENRDDIQMDSESVKWDNCETKCRDNSSLETNLGHLRLQSEEEGVPRSSWLELKLLDTWESEVDQIGLTGVELLDWNDRTVQITSITLKSSKNAETDHLDRLLDGDNRTTDVRHMWSVPFTRQYPTTLAISFKFLSCSPPICIRLWNYNDRRQGREYGVRLLELTGDPTLVDPVQLPLRRSPGHSEYPYGQKIYLKRYSSLASSLYPTVPSDDSKPGFGSVFQFEVYCAWQDQFYVGLDGLEMISSTGETIQIPSDAVTACPSSVRQMANSMPHCHSDVRTVDKLVDGIVGRNECMSQHCWLAPILPTQLNRIYFVFDTPVQVGGIKLWNYTRTPDRGVRDFAIMIDERLVFHGCLPKYGGNDHSASTCNYHIVVFDSDVFRRLGENSQRFLQPVSGIDQSSVPSRDVGIVSSGKRAELFSRPRLYNRLRSARVNQTLRPFTCVSESRHYQQ